MQKFPELKTNQVSLLRTNSQIGHTVDKTLHLVTNDEQQVYTIFDSYYDALKSGKSIIAKENGIECMIYLKNQQVLFSLSAEVEKAFNADFCDHLEYHLCRTFFNFPEEEIYSLGCDGVDIPFENHLTRKKVTETKEITTMAWIGTAGEERYKMTIKLGENSLNNFEKGLSLIDCLPDEESLDWIIIDTGKRTIELQLL